MIGAMSDAAALDLLSVSLSADLPARAGSGLVAQQRWFSRLHAKNWSRYSRPG